VKASNEALKQSRYSRRLPEHNLLLKSEGFKRGIETEIGGIADAGDYRIVEK